MDGNDRKNRARYAGFYTLAVHRFWEDLSWQRKHEPIEWLEKLIQP
jgi:hypothetical protein